MVLRRALGVAVGLPAKVGRIPVDAVKGSLSVVRLVSEAVADREVHSPADGHRHIAVKGEGGEKFAADLETALGVVEGVERAEVNGVLGEVLVVADGVADDLLVDVVDEVEREHGLADEPHAGAAHPGRAGSLVEEAVHAGANLAGWGVAVVAASMRMRFLPSAVPAVLGLADVSPPLRAMLERTVGRKAADNCFSAGLLASQVLAVQPVGLMLAFARRASHVAELRARRDVWHRRAGELIRPDSYRAEPLTRAPRPAPLPDGPVETVQRWSGPVSFTASAGVFAFTRNAERAEGVVVAGVPKAARLGREAFCGQLSRALAERDALVMDPASLRRLDRVDRVLLDAAALRTGHMIIDEVIPLTPTPDPQPGRSADPGPHGPERGRSGEAGPHSSEPEHSAEAGAVDGGSGGEGYAPEELYARAHALVDLSRPRSVGREGAWLLSPLSRASRLFEDDAEVTARLAALRGKGALVLLLEHRDAPVALVSVVPELHPTAEALVVAARKAGLVIVVGDGRGLDKRLRVDGLRVVPPADAVRALQAEDHVVALVSPDDREALWAADVGIGVLTEDGPPPWGADVLCGPGLETACLLLDCVPKAHDNSRRSARTAKLGSLTALLLSAAGPATTADKRAQLAVDLAGFSAFAQGAWAGLALTRMPAPVSVDRTPWYSWPVKEVLDHLRTSPEGLTEEEAAHRRAGEGHETPQRHGLTRLVLEELDNPLTPALALGAGVSAVVGSVTDATLIGVVLSTNAVMSGLQRLGADRALRGLVGRSAVKVRITRPDGEHEAVGEDLVPGDIIRFTAGDSVPADCRLLSADNVEMDESSLTGESQLVAKEAEPSFSPLVAERRSMLYQGTVVAAGDAVGVVVATGSATEVGRTAHLAGAIYRETGVERRLRELTRVTLPVSLAAGISLLGSNLLRGQPFGRALGSAVSLAVAAVPEGLPFVATAAELATARRLTRRGALVRNPATIEALGRVDVLCFDKTGTLTEGRLRLREVSDGVASAPVGELPDRLLEVVGVAMRAGPDLNGERPPHPTDRAVMYAVDELALSERMEPWERLDELPFEPARGYHAVLGSSPQGRWLSVKGAPELVLDKCATWQRDGESVPFDAAARAQVADEIEALARRGFRVLAVADRPAPEDEFAELTEEGVQGLVFLGLLCIADPVRPTAAAAVARLRTAGVGIIMITGDHPSTAEAIAADLGILDGRVMTGADLDELGDADLAKALSDVSVFARMTPAQKARTVGALRTMGKVVAVTGDGANDAPAIRLADVGIALGERASPAAREAADVVITDNRIETITQAIADCRAMWRSTRDALAVLLGGNLGEIGFTVGTGLLMGASPLNVRQLLLVNMLTDLLPAIALAVRPPHRVTKADLLAEGPERSLGAALTHDIAVRGITTAAAAFAAFVLGHSGGSRLQASTTGLVALVATQLFQTIAAGGRDPLVLASGVFSLTVLAAVVQIPGLSHFFGSRPLMPQCWLIAYASAATAAALAFVLTRIPIPDASAGLPARLRESLPTLLPERVRSRFAVLTTLLQP
ncbi:HAD-IC family P-type ATPase [Actinocorallia sp. A-T 12471]|uniref:cation-translocating P-type ATPase n=1 Tax=Actinocorallia sp. A-T 12471 TaxID=3089813 RepID=UPI0029D3F348|nr:HAD-IC family P-type ATPase [Actinocorallia sp. A-T 12471]MDX6738727.1 HAD-IC family P-type ATPase [Actinocorallia sp. A-T 12471]